MNPPPGRSLVFGGSGALGRVVCRALASRGARVVFTFSTREAVARELESELPGSLALPLDLLSLAEIERTVEHAAAALGGLDGFVQSAGVAITVESASPTTHHRMPEIDERAWDLMMDVNAKSTFFAVRTISEIMREGGGGNIVLVGSIDGVKPVPSPVHYAASKGALTGMTQAMAKELGKHAIRVNLVAPGIMEDGISRSLPEDLRREYLKHCGLKRLARIEEVAHLIAWLTTMNTYVSGQTLLVDGGL